MSEQSCHYNCSEKFTCGHLIDKDATITTLRTRLGAAERRERKLLDKVKELQDRLTKVEGT